MVTHEQALAKVQKYLEDSYVPVQIVRDEEFSDGWYFCYESKEYMDTEKFSARLIGNAPLLVDRDSGELFVLATSQPVKMSVEDYVSQKRALRGKSDASADLKRHAERVQGLISSAAPLDRDAEYFKANEFLQTALRDACRGLVEVPRGDDGLERWMLEHSETVNADLVDSLARFLLLLRGLNPHADPADPTTSF